jgi:hypothetical protein
MIEDKKGLPFEVLNLSSTHRTDRVLESLSKQRQK